MAVSRRLRFEILRRDGSMCRYCGAGAGEKPLTIDHVLPVALGGTDEPSNLVTACHDCNAGKSSINPDSPLVSDVEADALRWARAIERAAWYLKIDREVMNDAIGEFESTWDAWTYGDDKTPVPRQSDWPETIERFLNRGLPLDAIKYLVGVAMRASKVSAAQTWSYFCGCCWRKLDDLEAQAHHLIKNDESL
jgi:hypothetical protein